MKHFLYMLDCLSCCFVSLGPPIFLRGIEIKGSQFLKSLKWCRVFRSGRK